MPVLPELNTRVPLLWVNVPLLVQLPPTLKLPILGAISVALEAMMTEPDVTIEGLLATPSTATACDPSPIVRLLVLSETPDWSV